MTLIQVVSILCVAAIMQLFPTRAGWISVMASSTFSHYILAVLYAKRQVRELGTHPRFLLPLAAVAVIGTSAYLSGFPIVIYFGLHHVFNEIYIVDRARGGGDGPVDRNLRTAALICHLFIYFTIVRDHNHMRWIADSALFTGLAASFCVYVFLLVRALPTLSAVLRRSSIQLVGLIMVGVSFFVEIEFLNIVLYHVVFWVFYPLTKMVGHGSRPIIRYLSGTVGITALFLLISPMSNVPFRLTANEFNHQLVLWAFVHITLSLALSTAHPTWITRWFQPGFRRAT